ncbi:signal peptide peptidase SppA [Planctomicrobium sp. SH668]|uniref:signal peptide peptidase SppA n=1 Tax=Planctomicrobium sp. SH668 TaxID=3448126 RepID=UPI003F5C8B68
MNALTTDGNPPVHTAGRRSGWKTWVIGFLVLVLLSSFALNLMLGSMLSVYMTTEDPPIEQYHSGDKKASAKIARIVTDFTIMPPHTHRLIDTIKHVAKDDDVKGIMLVIDSPGGLVSDSHQIYHELMKLNKIKPIYVSMKGIAASGGYYIAMGAGPGSPIYAEPTTWTGSIGVIMPRYDASELAKKVGITSDSLVTGPFKETLSPFKAMSESEKAVWDAILNDSFQRFLAVIDDSRENLDRKQVEAIATGQVYTANQALENGLIDKIGYEEDAIEALKLKLGLSEAKVVDFTFPKSLSETLLGATADLSKAQDPVSRLIDLSTPRAMYYFGSPIGLAK